MTGETALFVAVVGARFLVPLLIPRFPLPAVLAALVLDAADQSIFQAFGYDPPGYQGYDKAMDMYYLAIAYLSTMRNWASRPAARVAAFLYFYRLVGVVAFELTQWRSLLLIFPNTFEYFFIAYEVVRLRRDPARYGMRFWVTVAAVIWIFVKLPQEYWIHIAQLDFTDTVAEYSWFGPLIAVAIVAAALVTWFVIRPRLRVPDWPWRVAADPRPAGMRTAAERSRWIAANGRVLSLPTLEKVLLVGFLSVIFGQVLPELNATNGELFLGIAAFVCVNAAISLWEARAGHGYDSILAAFGARVLINVVLVVLADWLLTRGDGGMDEGNALFFILLLSLITLLDDRYRPVQAARLAGSGAAGAPGAPAAVS